MSDDQPEPPKPPTIHLGMMSAGDKGPGSYIGGAFKLRGDLDQDLRSAALDFMKAADRCLNGNKEEAGVELLTAWGGLRSARVRIVAQVRSITRNRPASARPSS